MPDITPSEFRSQANGIINCMGGIGTIVALQTGGMLYKMSPNFPFWLGSGLTDVVELSGAATHTCARKSDGSVWCWGDNGAGELGVGTALSSLVPLAVTLSCPTP